MPAFTFSSPDGKSYTVNGPEGATSEQAFSMLQQQIGSQAKPPAAPAQGNAFSDIIPEIKKAAGENIDAIKSGFVNNPQEGAVSGLLNTGKGILGVAGLAASPITGAARSLLGHPLASATHAIGGMINPEVAAKDDPAQMYEHAKEGVDTAMMAAAPRGASPMGMRPGAAPPVPSGRALRADAAETYNNPAIKSIPIPSQDVANLSSRLENDLLRRGFRPTPGSAPGTLTEIQRMTPDPAIPHVNVDDIRAARIALGRRAKERTLQGEATPDAEAAGSAIREIDGFLDNVTPALQEANQNYAAGSQAGTLHFRNIQAEHRAAKTGSGSNIENTMRQEVDKIKDYGLRPNEVAARNQIVEGTVARNALRKIGKIGFGDGLSLMYHVAAFPATGGTSLPIGLAATAARKIGEALTRREIRALSETIRARSPTAQALDAAPRNPQTIPQQTRAIAALLLGGNRSQIPYAAAVMPSHAQDNQ